MRVLWISFLLFGLAACVPMLKYGSNSGTRLVQPTNHRFRGTSGGGSAQSPGFYQAYSGPSTYQGSAPYYSPDHYAVPSPDGYNVVQPWWNGQPNSGFQSDEGQGPSQELVPKPFYSDVSELDPVSSFSSRSRYQRGNVVFSRTRYIPGEPASFRPVLPQPLLPQQQFPQPLLPQQQFPQPLLPQQQFPQPPQQPVPRDAAAKPRGLVYSYQNYGY